MKDPYSILGVPHGADDEAIKQAYRDKLNEYQKHRFTDTPESEGIEEKILELNEAYDEIMIGRKQGETAGPKVSYQTGPTSSGASESQFLDVRRLIQSNRMSEAEEILDGVPPARRDAEWYFLKGSIQYSRGWLEDAYENFDRAVQMDPENQEYQATISQLRWQRQTGRGYQPGPGGYRTNPTMVGCNICDVCTTLYCTRCCCQCMGMDCC